VKLADKVSLALSGAVFTSDEHRRLVEDVWWTCGPAVARDVQALIPLRGAGLSDVVIDRVVSAIREAESKEEKL